MDNQSRSTSVCDVVNSFVAIAEEHRSPAGSTSGALSRTGDRPRTGGAKCDSNSDGAFEFGKDVDESIGHRAIQAGTAVAGEDEWELELSGKGQGALECWSVVATALRAVQRAMCNRRSDEVAE